MPLTSYRSSDRTAAHSSHMVTARCSLSTEIMTGQRLEQACYRRTHRWIGDFASAIRAERRRRNIGAVRITHGRGTLLSLLRDASGAPRGLGAINCRTQRRPILTWRIQCRQAARRSQLRCMSKNPDTPRWRWWWHTQNTFVVSVPRCCAGSETSRGQTDCIISLPRCCGRTTSCFGCFRIPAGPAPDTLRVRCYTSRSTSVWSPPLAKR